jgi:hypothetical protein
VVGTYNGKAPPTADLYQGLVSDSEGREEGGTYRMMVLLARALDEYIKYVSMMYERNEMKTSVKDTPRNTAKIAGAHQGTEAYWPVHPRPKIPTMRKGPAAMDPHSRSSGGG